ncbi:LLM class flavin-dependent oxidoreductase [Pseudonocardia sp. H11422]|uniref:LLM class flavin-dependent oxidoreductase n=1 Tax=Pseudonocardia sp. H11422 TaxID=2835866 RepID=UPI001BDDC769|nr:LLM class flavin-dependent oxidoreductase [Pseudonocardia sp. H11422]
MSNDLRVGMFFPSFVWPDSQEMEPIDQVDACLERCEQYGYGVWVVDHLLVAPGLYGATWLDPMAFLSYAAARTRTVELGTAILVAPLRQPVLLAKEIGSLQLLSGGRFNLGVGPGWHANEFSSVGAHISERGRRTDELLESVKILLEEPAASYHGKYYDFEDVTLVPRTGMPPVWVAGGARIPDPNERDLPEIALTVRDRIVKAGRWLSRASGKQEWVKRDWKMICEHAEQSNVDPAGLTFGHCNWFHLVDAKNRADAIEQQRDAFTRVMGTHRSLEHLQECYLLGTTEEIIERLRDLIAAGCTYLCVGPTEADPEQIDRFATDVLPHLS